MSFTDFGIAAVPVITVIVFLVVEAVKATALDNKWMPVIAGFCGGCLGMAAVYLMPEFPAKDPLTAIAVGIVSGLAATGVHQIYKQLLDKGVPDEKDLWKDAKTETEHLPDVTNKPLDEMIDDFDGT